MSKFNTAITEAMEALDAEIESVEQELEDLRATRKNLETVLVEDDGDSPKKSRKSQSTIKVSDKRTTGKESTKRERIIHMLQDGVKISDIAEEVDVTPNYIYTIRKAEKLDTGERSEGGKRGRRSSNGNGSRSSSGKLTKRQQIKNMLADDMSVKDIADELGISPGYVYNVKRG